jgi:hypothetical protein
MADLFCQRDGPDEPGFDEWYLFTDQTHDLGEEIEGNPWEPENAPRRGRRLVFVTYISFSLHDSGASGALPEWFWNQMAWINPESYVSDGMDCLTFLSREESTFELVLRRLRGDCAEEAARR